MQNITANENARRIHAIWLAGLDMPGVAHRAELVEEPGFVANFDPYGTTIRISCRKECRNNRRKKKRNRNFLRDVLKARAEGYRLKAKNAEKKAKRLRGIRPTSPRRDPASGQN